MKFKMKKSYWIVLIVAVVIFLIWILTRSAFSDTCSMSLNSCLMGNKFKSFFPRMWGGLVCTLKNIGCLIGQLF